MKKLILIAVAAFMFQPVSAQQSTPQGAGNEKVSAETRADRKTTRMEKELVLTADQKIKVKAENLSFAQKTDALRVAHKDLKSEAAKSDYKSAHKVHRENMKVILTAEQYTRWVEMEKADRNKKGAAGK